MYAKLEFIRRHFIFFSFMYFTWKYFFPKSKQKIFHKDYQMEEEWGQFVDIFY